MLPRPLLTAAVALLPALAFSQSSPATTTPPTSEEVVVLDPFVVNALSDERNRSLEAKRNADSIGDFLSPDRLGQFVDDNIGAVVERLPGVYTSGAGQSGGSGISIRGLGGGFNSLQVDGDRIPSNQGGTRGVSIDNLPAELIGAIEIFKAPTPEKDADSIGGVVNVETKSGLDLRRRLVASRVLYGFDDYGSGDQWAASLSYSDRVAENLGLFFALSYRENTRFRDEIRADPGDYVFDQLVTTNPALPQMTAANTTRVFMPSRTDFRRTVQSQQNTGANLNLDWQATDTLRLSFRSFFAQFEEQRPQIRNLWRHDRSTGNDPVNRNFPHPEYVYLASDGTFYFGNEQRIARRIADQDETERIVRVQLEAVHRWRDSTLDYSASFGRAQRDMVNDTYIFTADDIQLVAGVGTPLAPRFDVIRPGEFFYNTTQNPRVPNFNDPTFYGPPAPAFSTSPSAAPKSSTPRTRSAPGPPITARPSTTAGRSRPASNSASRRRTTSATSSSTRASPSAPPIPNSRTRAASSTACATSVSTRPTRASFGRIPPAPASSPRPCSAERPAPTIAATASSRTSALPRTCWPATCRPPGPSAA